MPPICHAHIINFVKFHLPYSHSLQADANQLFFEKVREELGFQECRIFAVGSAPMRMRIHDYFSSIKIPLQEMYRLSESSGLHTLSPDPQKGVHVGSCGKPIFGVKQKIIVDEKGHHEVSLEVVVISIE